MTAEGEERESGKLEREGKNAGEPAFCKNAGFPRTPSGKNSYMAGGKDSADVGAHGDAPSYCFLFPNSLSVGAHLHVRPGQTRGSACTGRGE